MHTPNPGSQPAPLPKPHAVVVVPPQRVADATRPAGASRAVLHQVGIALPSWTHRPVTWATSWVRLVMFAAQIAVLAVRRKSYTPGAVHALAFHVYHDTAPAMTWFTVLVALVSLILARIVVVTAQSYGLSQYAIEMVVRTLVLELIPITVALFVALRSSIAHGAAVSKMRRNGVFAAMRAQGTDPMTHEMLPRVLAALFATLFLAVLSCVVAVVLAYAVINGFTTAGLPGYTRIFGQVFTPAVALVFVLKTFFFSLAVAVIPLASGQYDLTDATSRTQADLSGLVRLFGVILLIEAASLVGNYY